MKNKILLVVFVTIFLSLFATNVKAGYCSGTETPEWSVSSALASPQEVSLGGTVTITVPIQNNEPHADLTCSITIGDKYTSKQITQDGGIEELSLQINAPSYDTTVQKTETVNIQVYCYGEYWIPFCTQRISGTLTRSASYVWPTYAQIIERQKISQAYVEWENAKNIIIQAESSVSKAKSSIQEAQNLKIDVSTAQPYLTESESKLTEAKNLNTVAYNLVSGGGDVDVATEKFKSAQNSASQSRTSADNAYSMSNQLVEAYKKIKLDAQNKVSDAKSAIDRANEMVKKAENIISDASVLGLDTAKAKANLDTGKAKADLGNNYYNEAKTALDQNNFDSAKSKASSAISYANEGESYSTTAYNSLSEQVEKLGTVAKSLTSANEEIRKMNDVYTKMDYIIKSAEKWGVILAQAKNTVAIAKTDVDSAEDLMSQAQNRREAGVFEEAARLAIQARDAAAKATNRLDTIVQSISTQTQDALEKATSEMEQEVKKTESEVSAAEQTYGADAIQIVSAKNSLSSAKAKLTEAKSAIQNVQSASGLENVLTEADTAFKKLEGVQDELNNSLEKVGLARRIRIIKNVAIGAGIVALAGGGFLYYRKRKGKKPEKEVKEEHKRAVKEKGRHCTSCGAKLHGEVKFCPDCGKEVRK